jgi:hypothetical protein
MLNVLRGICYSDTLGTYVYNNQFDLYCSDPVTFKLCSDIFIS